MKRLAMVRISERLRSHEITRKIADATSVHTSQAIASTFNEGDCDSIIKNVPQEQPVSDVAQVDVNMSPHLRTEEPDAADRSEAAGELPSDDDTYMLLT